MCVSRAVTNAAIVGLLQGNQSLLISITRGVQSTRLSLNSVTGYAYQR